jgi:type IX secretion system PorP/SprF family membrane protein
MKKTPIFCSLLFACMRLSSQDPVYANTNQSLIMLNPAYAGSNGSLRNQLSYRAEAYNASSAIKTWNNSFDMYFKNIKSGVAISFMNDDYANGTLVTQWLGVSFNHQYGLLNSDLKIIPSLQFSAFSKTLDRSNLHFGDPIDGRRQFSWHAFSPVPISNKKNLDFSGGFLMRYKEKANFGAYVFHIFQPDQGLLGPQPLFARLSLHGSYNFSLSEKNQLQLFARHERQYKYSFTQLSCNMILLKHLATGITMIKMTPGVMLGYQNRFLSLQCNYNFPIAQSPANARTALEIHLSVSINKRPEQEVVAYPENR